MCPRKNKLFPNYCIVRKACFCGPNNISLSHTDQLNQVANKYVAIYWRLSSNVTYLSYIHYSNHSIQKSFNSEMCSSYHTYVSKLQFYISAILQIFIKILLKQLSYTFLRGTHNSERRQQISLQIRCF